MSKIRMPTPGGNPAFFRVGQNLVCGTESDAQINISKGSSSQPDELPFSFSSQNKPN